MTGVRKRIFTRKQVYLNTGLWIGEKQVEIYLNDGKEDGATYFYLYKTITEENKKDLQFVMFPNLKTEFDELFSI